ncbi:unnamed protein product [Dicrocoelium dendriticum]|nr:unnamed protein product [Dicrocoelium dendriticum]
MSGVAAGAGVTKDGPTFPALLKPFLPSHFSSVTENQAIAKPAEYIGSFMVAGKGHHDRAEIVRQKLESARKYTQSRPIVLLISLNGIKVCRDDDQHVYMAHALRRISYATCDPENFQFAFLAREPKSEPNVQYCHAFVTNTAEEAEELNNIVGEAFRMAYAQQQMALLSRQLQHTSISPQPAPCQSATSAPLASTGHDPSQPCPVPNGVLVPAPETESVSQISPLRCGGTVMPTINTNQSGVPQKPLPAIPTTQPVAMPPEPAPLTNPSTHAAEYTPRGHKLHK